MARASIVGSSTERKLLIVIAVGVWSACALGAVEMYVGQKAESAEGLRLTALEAEQGEARALKAMYKSGLKQLNEALDRNTERNRRIDEYFKAQVKILGGSK